MLVLTRKLQERIKIGENVTITVLRVKGNAVRIGIEAPRNVRVIRAELPAGGAETAEAGGYQPTSEGGSETTGSADSAAHETRADSQSNLNAPSLRFPQRRLVNRCGIPPLRLACSHVMAASETMS